MSMDKGHSRNSGKMGDTSSEPIDLTKPETDSKTTKPKQVICRRKPKKFVNLSEDDIEEKRHTANVQERHRMKKLSKALEELRKCIPAEYHLSNRKMSKIRTLKLAVKYIAGLSEMLERDTILKQQAFHLESQMIQSTYSYLLPSPANVQSLFHSGQQTTFSPYHTPYGPLDQRLPMRHLNFSPFCSTPLPVSVPRGKSLFQTPIKQEISPFRTPEMMIRRRTCTITSPNFVSDMRNINELSSSFVSPSSDDSALASRPPQVPDPVTYTYTLDGVSPLPEEEGFRGGTDCVYDPRRLRNSKE